MTNLMSLVITQSSIIPYNHLSTLYYKLQSNKQGTHIFAPRCLIFKLQQVLRFHDIHICRSLWDQSSLKIDLVINLLNLENWSFQNVSFCSTMLTFIDILLLKACVCYLLSNFWKQTMKIYEKCFLFYLKSFFCS